VAGTEDRLAALTVRERESRGGGAGLSESVVRYRVRNLVEVSLWQSLSLWLPAAACMIVVIFFMASLVQASPAWDDSPVVLARSDVSGAIDPPPPSRHATGDSVSENEQDVRSAPLPAPMYHDRYDFYHRYDHYRLPSRFGTLDDGID
jgi:hypothetical protein